MLLFWKAPFLLTCISAEPDQRPDGRPNQACLENQSRTPDMPFFSVLAHGLTDQTPRSPANQPLQAPSLVFEQWLALLRKVSACTFYNLGRVFGVGRFDSEVIGVRDYQATIVRFKDAPACLSNVLTFKMVSAS